MSSTTALHAKHLEAGAKMVDFFGWDMPINYGSQIEEHHAVRQDAGMFDVSHMTIVDVKGAQAKAYLSIFSQRRGKTKDKGKAPYSGMLNEEGGVVDDLIVYHFDELTIAVVNSAMREKDMNWLMSKAEGFDVTITERPEFAMIAVQGPTQEKAANGQRSAKKR